MKNLIRLILSVACVAACSLGSPLTASASAITLTYTGNAFTSFYSFGSLPSDVYTTADRVTGVIDLLAPLDANLVGVYVTPESFKFSDGVNKLTDADPMLDTSRTTFQFWTDASGQVVNWAVNMMAFDPGVFRSTIQTLNLPGTSGVDSGTSTVCGPVVNCIDGSGNLNTDPMYSLVARADEAPGTWKVKPKPVPEPSSLLLLGVGLVGLVRSHRKRNGDRGPFTASLYLDSGVVEALVEAEGASQ